MIAKTYEVLKSTIPGTRYSGARCTLRSFPGNHAEPDRLSDNPQRESDIGSRHLRVCIIRAGRDQQRASRYVQKCLGGDLLDFLGRVRWFRCQRIGAFSFEFGGEGIWD